MNLDNYVTAADTARMQAGGKSIFEKVADAVTAGTAGAVVSGWHSIYNTGAFYANSVFDLDIKQKDTAKVLGELDTNWRKYYEQNREVIDTVGFIGGAFIPGGAAVKGLQLARTGSNVGAFGKALGFTQRMQEKYLEKGLQELAQEGGSVFSRLNSNKLASMAAGAADNVLQASVFETAAALSMHQSPLFADADAGDIAWDVVKTSLAGGLLGGGVEALFTNRIYKNAGKLVDKSQRKYDTITALEKLDLNFGDKTFALIDEVLSLPETVVSADKALKFKYTLNGRSHDISLDTGDLFDRKLQETADKGLQLIAAKLTNEVASDTTVGKPVAAALLKILHDGKANNIPAEQIKSKLGDYLFGLTKIEGMGAAGVDFSREVRYLNPAKQLKTLDDLKDVFSKEKIDSKAAGYRMHGNFEDAKIGFVGVDAASVKNTFESGFDIAVKADGKISVNPKSTILRPVTDWEAEGGMRMLFNTRTGEMLDSGVATVADIATGEKPLQQFANGVSSAGKLFEFSVGNFDEAQDAVKATARHLWASKVKTLSGQVINSNDFSLLDAIIANPKLASDGTEVLMPGGIKLFLRDLGDFQSWVIDQKIEAVKNLLKSEKGMDIREIAYRINAEPKWVAKAVEAEFDQTMLLDSSFTRDLSSYGVRENIVFSYQRPTVAKGESLSEPGDFLTGIQAYNYRKQVAIQKTQEASAAVLGEDFHQLVDFDYSTLKGKFDATGVGATTAGFSNADYGDIGRLWSQDVGGALNRIAQKRTNRVMNQIQAPAAEILADPKAGAELAAVLTKVRRTGEPLSLLDGKLVDLKSKKMYLGALEKGNVETAQKIQFSVSVELSPKVVAFLEKHHEIHQRQLKDRKILANSQGTVLHWEDDALYLPPIDTRKVPYFAFVRQKDGAAFGTSEVAMLTARTPEELQRLATGVDKNQYDVIFKGDTEDWFKAKGDYEYTRAMNQPTLDPFLRKQGKLGDFLPSLDSKATVEDFIMYHERKEKQLTRDSAEVKYAQTFAELRWLSNQNTKVEKSKFEFLGRVFQQNIKDPFGDYIKTALDISKRSEYTLWHQANEFVDALGTRAYQAVEKGFQEAKQGKISWEEGNQIMERMGLGQPFKSQEAFLTAQTGNDRNLIKQAVAKANMILSTVALRFDFAHSLVNLVATPIMLGTELSSIRRSVQKDPELAGKLAQLTHTQMPGMDVSIPSTTRLVANAVQNFWTEEGKALLNGRYKEIGAVKDMVSQYHKMIEDLSLVPNLAPKEWAKRVEGWTEKVSTITGNNFSEDFTRFVSADVMRQLTDPLVAAKKMSAKEQNAYISIFVNRVQGNYIASQRPILFQGTIGAALGLFQTYQFNLFQQLFRHISNRDAKTVAVMAGLQSTLFGLNGLPLFEAVNTHLIGMASVNEGHQDAYSFIAKMNGENRWGDAILYGAASAFPIFSDKAPSLYTRGDLNPRHVTIVPTSFSQIPAVEASTRVVTNLLNMGKQLGNGVDLGTVLLHGLEHNGVNRPLAGIAQVLKGNATTASGNLISATSDFSAVATASRVLGAKPMDESIGLNAKFRSHAYKAFDRERVESLGTAVKQKIRDGSLSEEDVQDFMIRYAQIGGRADQYAKAMQRWMRDANQSVVNKAMNAHHTALGQRIGEIMGFDPLDDYTNIDTGVDE